MNAALKLDLSARAFALALLGTVLVLAGASWFVVISPKHDKAATLQTKIQSDQSRLAMAAHEQATKEVSAIGKDKAVDSALPQSVAMPQILEQLNAMANQSDVTLDTVTPGVTVPETGYVAVPLTVVVDGQYFAVRKFLQLVRNQVTLGKAGKPKFSASGRLFGVTSMRLDQTEPAPTVTATFNMNAYYYSPSSIVPLPASTTSSSGTSAG